MTSFNDPGMGSFVENSPENQFEEEFQQNPFQEDGLEIDQAELDALEESSPDANIQNIKTLQPIDKKIIDWKWKPIPIARHQVSGSYETVQSGWQLILRVDVDGTGNLRMASFDFFRVGSTTSYWGSFIMRNPTVVYGSTKVTVSGSFTGTKSMWANRAKIEISRNYIFATRASAKVTMMQNSTSGAIYTCAFKSQYFRTLQLETDVEQGTTLFGSYNTGTYSNPGPTRTLNLVSAFQEAGIQMNYTGSNNYINTSEAGSDSRWTESEMHASMVRHFSVYKNSPQWAVWLFAARRAVSNTLLGIMFDYKSSNKPHRQGAAVFQDTLASYFSGNNYTRNQLFTYVHELGHAFNLLHSWDKSRPDSLSWMNYPWGYDNRNGSGQFWANFTFAFDTGELEHLRHGYYNSVVMGGNDWAQGAGLEAPHRHIEDLTADIHDDNSGLRLEIVPIKSSYALGEPVVVEIKLRSRLKDDQRVNAHVHPKYEQVRIGIMKPNGQVMNYEPVGHNCVAVKDAVLTDEKDTLYASAYIGYGRDGFYFDAPGIYKIKGAYRTPDGSVIQSEDVKIRVKSPLNAQEDAIADSYFHDDVGMLFYLMGSDSPSLKNGNDLLKEVSEKHAKNSLSIYADFILGINESMTYKIVDPESQKLQVRKRDLGQATSHLDKVFSESAGDKGIDNITLNWAYRQLANGMLKEGDEKAAVQLMKSMEATFKKKKLKASVMETIKSQINSLLANR
jgi:hypothetical protein